MPQISIIVGALLIFLGVYGYFGSDPGHRSPTAFIPAGFGVVIAICGVVALNDKLRKHAMHGAVLFGLLGFLGGAGTGFPKLGGLFSGDPEVNVRALVMVLAMTAICFVYVLLCVNSFIQARKKAKASTVEDTATEESAST